MDPSRSPPRLSSIPETPFPRFSVRGVRSHRVRERKLRNSVMHLGRGERVGDGLYAIVPFRFGKARETCHSRPRIRSSNAFALNDHVRSKSFLSLKRFLEKRVRGVKFRLNSDLKIE